MIPVSSHIAIRLDPWRRRGCAGRPRCAAGSQEIARKRSFINWWRWTYTISIRILFQFDLFVSNPQGLNASEALLDIIH